MYNNFHPTKNHQHKQIMFLATDNQNKKNFMKIVISNTDRFDSCDNADVTSEVDRLEYSPVLPLPVNSDDGWSKCFRHFPCMILWVPSTHNIILCGRVILKWFKHDITTDHVRPVMWCLEAGFSLPRPRSRPSCLDLSLSLDLSASVLLLPRGTNHREANFHSTTYYFN